MSIHKYYKIDSDGKLIRLNPFCPRCGPGFFMAQNYDRLTCGKYSFTEFKKRHQKKAKATDEASKKKGSKGTGAPKKKRKKQ